MIKRVKEWLYMKFLPAWAKESVYNDNKKLREENAELRQRLQRLNAYIDGLEAGIRSQRRVVIKNEVNKQ